MNLLYAGDSPVGGPADYVLAVLKHLRATVRHLPPSQTLHPRVVRRRFDAIILSDFPRARVPRAAEAAMARQVEDGAGLLMVGGWSSFAGPSGGWRGSRIESLLPVRCLGRDDRKHFPSGALTTPQTHHPMLRSLSFREPPVICGLNHVQPKARSTVVLAAAPLVTRWTQATGGAAVRVSPAIYPLLVVDSRPRRRAAALTTDLAPHWCGGLVDWGPRRFVLPVTRTIRVEVGNRYLQFVSSLVRWLAQADIRSSLPLPL